jgi:alkanesulfonate monooxygenase SsuD/methylene tetrahydromethanopterin reductase-like flavin-dependent oxidoreductase (luciferase family)
MGYVMTTQDPIRVAEETAVLDHLTQGRFFVGFARGYQARWTNILGQQYGGRATSSPAIRGEAVRAAMAPEQLAREEADDRLNRDVFEEHVDLIVEAWTSESIAHRSTHLSVPYPYEDGIPWSMTPADRLGAPGELVDGRIRRISVVPAPYTRPHPQVFVGSSSSPDTTAYCGRRGFSPAYFASAGIARRLSGVYREAAAASGRELAEGQGAALVRWPRIAPTPEAVEPMLAAYDLEMWRNFYASNIKAQSAAGTSFDQMLASGLWAAGTAEGVRADLVKQWQRFPAEYIVLIYHFALQPADSVIEQLGWFMEHVKPALDELTPYER